MPSPPWLWGPESAWCCWPGPPGSPSPVRVTSPERSGPGSSGSSAGSRASSFVDPFYAPAGSTYAAFGGYEGLPLGFSVPFMGWGLLAVLVGGLVAFFRDRRLWFFGLVLAVSAVGSLEWHNGQLGLIAILAKIPVLDNVAVQRFMAVGLLAAAVMLGIILDHVRRLAPRVDRLARGVGAPARRGPALGKDPGLVRRGCGGSCRAAPDRNDVPLQTALHHAAGRLAPLVHPGGAETAPRTRSCCRTPRPFRVSSRP